MFQNIYAYLYPPAARDAARRREKITGSLAFDAVIVALSAWLIGGAYLDGWAHIHIPDLETFFTPWHAVLYSGFLACAAFLLGIIARNIILGYPLRRAIPAGYELSVLGLFIFGMGGAGDFIWHTLFGIEANIEALLSPTHLILATGAALIVTGPLRAAWLRFIHSPQKIHFLSLLPAVLSLTIFYSLLTFFTEYASPFEETIVGINRLPPNASEALRFQALGVADFLLQAVLFVGIILFLIRRWDLPFGSLTLLMGLNAAAMSLMHDGWFSTGTTVMIFVGFLAGLSFDLLYWRLAPSTTHLSALRWFAFLMPVILYTLYYLALFLFGGGVWWSIHLWVGSILMSGVAGFLVSYAFVPPPLPEG